jgi:hypothetical protein
VYDLYSEDQEPNVLMPTARSVVRASYLYTAGSRLPIYRNVNLVTSRQFLAVGRFSRSLLSFR